MSFIDDLTKIAQSDFGSGFVKYGAAIKYMQDTDKLADLEQKFKVGQDELLTTPEQLDKFTQEYIKKEGVTEPQDIEASKQLAKYLWYQEQSQANSRFYAPFITAFTSLGERGIQKANALTKELNLQLSHLEKQSGIPLVSAQIKSNIQSYETNKIKYNEMVNQVKRNQEYIDVFNLLSTSGYDDELLRLGGKRIYNNEKRIANHLGEIENLRTALEKDIMSRYIEEYGNKPSGDIVHSAIQKLFNDYNIDVTYKQPEPQTTIINNPSNPMDNPQDIRNAFLGEYKSLYDQYIGSPITAELRNYKSQSAYLDKNGRLDISKVHDSMKEKYGEQWDDYLDKFGGGGRMEDVRTAIVSYDQQLPGELRMFVGGGKMKKSGKIKKIRVTDKTNKSDGSDYSSITDEKLKRKLETDTQRVINMPFAYDVPWYVGSGNLLWMNGEGFDWNPEWVKDFEITTDEAGNKIYINRTKLPKGSDAVPLLDDPKYRRIPQIGQFTR